MVTYYKDYIGEQDVEFGTGVFNRINSAGKAVQLDQINKMHIPRKVVGKTASFVINKNTYPGEVTFTNASATGSITFSLPVATAGLGPYKFTVIAAYDLVVDPNGTELFRDCAAGKTKTSAIAGNALKVWCDTNGIWEWSDLLVSGVWTNEA